MGRKNKQTDGTEPAVTEELAVSTTTGEQASAEVLAVHEGAVATEPVEGGFKEEWPDEIVTLAPGNDEPIAVEAQIPAWTPRGVAPEVGDWVYFWSFNPSPTTVKPVPTPAQVIMHAPNGRDLHLNVHQLGVMNFHMDCPHSPTPKFGCWSRRKE